MTPVRLMAATNAGFKDENRARVVSKGSLRAIIALLKVKSLIPFVIPVLFNICFDYGMPICPCTIFSLLMRSRTCAKTSIGFAFEHRTHRIYFESRL